MSPELVRGLAHKVVKQMPYVGCLATGVIDKGILASGLSAQEAMLIKQEVQKIIDGHGVEAKKIHGECIDEIKERRLSR